MTEITNIMLNDDYTILIELSNHLKIIYDMKPRLYGMRFGELIDFQKFKSARLENGNTLVWSDQCQITIDEIISLIKR